MRISDWSSDVCSSDLARAKRQCLDDVMTASDAAIDQNLAHPRYAIRDFGKRSNGGLGVVELHSAMIGYRYAIGQIGRASCRERVCQYVYISVVAVSLKKEKTKYEHIY